MLDTLEVSTSVSAPIRPANAASQLVLRTQAGRKEEAERVAKHRKAPPNRVWSRLALAGVMLVSIFMNFYQLGQNGFGNLYYAAAIRSMLDSWHAPPRYGSPTRLDGHHIARRGL